VNPRRWPRTISSPHDNRRHQPIPKGLRPPAQGCEARATLGKRPQMETNPNGVVTKIVRLASRRICRNRVAVVPVLPRSPKVGACAPTLGFGPQPRWGWRESQRDSVHQPKVARHELPWVMVRKWKPTATRLRPKPFDWRRDQFVATALRLFPFCHVHPR
jgi:hypothetical protein